jgi:hypothetical protein
VSQRDQALELGPAKRIESPASGPERAAGVVVFLGPTLPHSAASLLLRAHYLPPAGCGDIIRALRLRPRVLALVDGVFEHRPAVWHKEILFALQEGVSVFGASSMGALRASELHNFGMVGVGKIFEGYRDGLITDDDEVALAHGDDTEGFRPLSDPMVNIRATLAEALRRKLIDTTIAVEVTSIAKATFYPERSLKGAILEAERRGIDRELLHSLKIFIAREGLVDQKRLDAVQLLKHLCPESDHSSENQQNQQSHQRERVQPTIFLSSLRQRIQCEPFHHSTLGLPEDERLAAQSSQLPWYPLISGLAQLFGACVAITSGPQSPQPLRKEELFSGKMRHFEEISFDATWTRRHSLPEPQSQVLRFRLETILAWIKSEERRSNSQGSWEDYLPGVAKLYGIYPLLLENTDRPVNADQIEETLNKAPTERAWLRLLLLLASLSFALDRATERGGLFPQQSDLKLALSVFRRQRDLATKASVKLWLTRNHMTWDTLQRLVVSHWRINLVCAAPFFWPILGLQKHVGPETCWLHDVLRITSLDTCIKTTFSLTYDKSRL